MSDEAYMERAIELARRGRGLVSPNPLVGAVVVSDGSVVGEGFHEGPGLPHAEVVALGQAAARARGATLFTSLEPCDHYGRTPPCTEAIVRSGIARVVSAARDPNPVVDGQGVRTLRARGVEVLEGILQAEAQRLNAGFAKHVRTGMPFVIWKAAASLDGKVAARDGSSRWITGDAARADVHRLRAWADAIVVGAGTALADDPELTVRDPDYRGRPPLRVLVDARGRVGPSGDLFDDQAPTLVATTELAPAKARDAWREAGAEVLVLETDGVGVGLTALMCDLGKRDVQGVLLEGGPTLAWSAVQERLVDTIVLYLSPKLLGGRDAPTVLEGRGFAPIGQALPLRIRSVERVGEDLRVEADVHGDR
ncbi:MAG TPA: bifunctional diaminohydroxyphosphoribosylaminopyrimidine deaminase/5-amino-6-(5-phosphoribosylamino)uracil reductase RibD [Actinomycetota bacterium]|nr:bifunctional diaminohydroxyphosphoribosylaminopyrimidine deaminase/5-amino-6-(5-phosphoribosylamino)uracil reductase RibD [Actinomycetota bacterium]